MIEMGNMIYKKEDKLGEYWYHFCMRKVLLRIILSRKTDTKSATSILQNIA